MSLFKLNPVTVMLIKEDLKDILLFSIFIPLAIISLMLGLNTLEIINEIAYQYEIDCEHSRKPDKCLTLFSYMK